MLSKFKTSLGYIRPHILIKERNQRLADHCSRDIPPTGQWGNYIIYLVFPALSPQLLGRVLLPRLVARIAFFSPFHEYRQLNFCIFRCSNALGYAVYSLEEAGDACTVGSRLGDQAILGGM